MNVRHGLVYLVSNIYVAAIPFFLMPFLLRVLTPAEYGVIGMFSSLVDVLTTIAGLALVSFLRNRLDENNPELNRDYILNCNAIISFVGFFLLIGAILLQLNNMSIGGVYPDLLIISVCFAVAQAFIGLKLVVWQLQSKSLWYGGFLSALATISAFFTVLFVFIMELADKGRIYGMVAPSILVGLFLLAQFFLSIKKNAVSLKIVRSILNYVTPLLPHALVLTGVLFVSRLLVEMELGVDAVGFYTVAFQLAAPITILVTSINLQFKVYSNQLMRNGEHRECVRVSYLLMLAFAFVSLLFVVFLLFFYELIVGGSFADAKLLSILFVFSSFLKGVYLIVSKGLMFVGETKKIMYISLFTASIYLIFICFAGSLLEFVVFYCVYNVLLTGIVWYWANQSYPQPWFSLFRKA